VYSIEVPSSAKTFLYEAADRERIRHAIEQAMSLPDRPRHPVID
jgi:hypothetical protein